MAGKKNKMNQRILIGCFEMPYDGGASTAAYRLFEDMQNDGYNVAYMNIISESDYGFYQYMFGEKFGNPGDLPNVYNCIVCDSYFYPDPVHKEIVDVIREFSPDILIGIDYIATLLMKKAAPEKAILFITAGCEQVKSYVSKRKSRDQIQLADYLLKLKHHPQIYQNREKEAVECADLILTHSEITRFFYEKFYPYQAGKIYKEIFWKAEIFYRDTMKYKHHIKAFDDRDIDILFVASDWTRLEKNYPFVIKIISDCRDLTVHVIGEYKHKSKNAVYHGMLNDRNEIFRIFGRSKTVVCPSLFDAAPGILFEASAMGCNIVASRNCGNWQICHSSLLVDPFQLDVFIKKTRLSLTKKYGDNIDYFMGSPLYKNLIDIISILNYD